MPDHAGLIGLRSLSKTRTAMYHGSSAALVIGRCQALFLDLCRSGRRAPIMSPLIWDKVALRPHSLATAMQS